MQFRFDRFLTINRRILSWVALVALLYVLRDLFAVIFVTFLLVSFTLPIINYFDRTTRIPRKILIVIVYVLLFTGMVSVLWYAIPNITAEARTAASELPKIQDKLLTFKDDIQQRYPQLKPLEQYVDTQARDILDNIREAVGPMLVNSAKFALSAATTLLLGQLFAFLVLLDLTRLTTEMRRFGRSRLHNFYQETADPVVQFFAVISKSFQAQAQIAILNTALTAIGFSIIGLPKMALMLMIVFFFSFIPVLGVFISTTPAMLVALNAKGWDAALAVLVVVTVIHLLEAYVFNPIIYGSYLRMNPVLTLLVLYVGHHFFGMWGALLSVPVATYFLYYVFGVPRDEGDVEPSSSPKSKGAKSVSPAS